MIYRVLECTLFGSTEDSVTVWLQAHSAAEAAAKIRRLLAIAWDVVEDDVCFGNVDSESSLENDSLLPLPTRGARWFEVGCSGDFAFFDNQSQMVLLDAAHRRRWEVARAEAVAVARDMAGKLQVLMDEEEPSLSGDVEHHIADLAAFAARG